jgi:hypothetical protein
LRARLLKLLDLSVAELEMNAARGGGGHPEAAGALALLGGALAHLAQGTGGAMNGRGMRDHRGVGGGAASAGRSGRGSRREADSAAHNKKNNNEPGCRAGESGADDNDELDRLRAEVKSRLDRLRQTGLPEDAQRHR